MAAIIAPSNRVEYNGFRFPDAFTSSSTTAKPVYDSSGRTVTHTVVTIRVKSQIVAGVFQDIALNNARAALEQPGGELYFTGKGYDIEVNTPGGRRDLKWGPRPQVLEWKTFGNNLSAEITWMCEVALLNCADAPWQNQIMELNSTLSFATDEGGYTVRTVTGSLTIPMTRQDVNSAAIPDTADNYFDRVVPPLLPNFKRTIQRSLSEARDKLSFTVTDTELAGNPLPKGVVTAEASHEINTVSSGKSASIFTRWNGTISATYEFTRGKPRSDAFGLFFELVKDRVDADRDKGFQCMPLSMRISEPQIYGRQAASLSMTYTFVWNTTVPNVENFMPTDGIWRPVPGGNWNLWSQSLGAARANRGRAELRHLAFDDVIVDLCLSRGLPNLRANARLPFIQALSAFGSDNLWDEVAQELDIPDEFSPIGSWISYECRLIVEPVDHNVIHKPLPVNSVPSVTGAAASAGASAVRSLFASTDSSFFDALQQSPPPIVQNLGSTDFFLRLVGRAVRVSHEIPPPSLVSVGDGTATPANHPSAGTFFSAWTAAYTTHPIQAAEWNLRYFVQLPQGSPGLSLVSPPRPDQPDNIPQGTVR
ncbi:hypothetical protein [Zavarzinella formosa]|uniref:hypothetical protein n=1 Tax=Zavarzinella formosa TaxID=360055 RepID=UPI0003130432|nr:hypothetical protein [Zavarzinella formosa]